ncbi:hypothetical protein CRG98_013250 [Punica granatum]|nr:hypothetical protein CRG98_013250 [Punica granatum]
MHDRIGSANLRSLKLGVHGRASQADLHEERASRLGELAKLKRECAQSSWPANLQEALVRKLSEPTKPKRQCARSSRPDRFARRTSEQARRAFESEMKVGTGKQARQIYKKHDRVGSANLRSVKESARASRPDRFARSTSEQARRT